MSTEISLKVRERIRELRGLNELTQERLAELSGVDYKHVQLLEGKNPTAARIDTIEKITKAFGLTLAEFFSTSIFDDKRTGKKKSK